MKIKKVDDKPMIIHTKEKAKIHAHEPKGAKIKGSNIYTVERGPKVHDAKACLLYTSMCNEDGYEEPFGDVTVNLSVAVPNYCGYLNVNDNGRASGVSENLRGRVDKRRPSVYNTNKFAYANLLNGA